MKCLKQVVTATIYRKGKILVSASNDIQNYVEKCPRLGMATGEGYDLCRSVCGQEGHAEIQAINKAKALGLDLEGSVLYLKGHTYVCSNCRMHMEQTGIDLFVIEDSECIK
jgi:deoxycytidylate deaminase